MKRIREFAVAIISFAALVAPGSLAGRDHLGLHAGALLEEVIKHYQNGELEQAWEAYREFFDKPSNGNVEIDAFGRCFYRQECPALGMLAFVLGKSETDAGNFRNFCPSWENLDTGHLSPVEIADGIRKISAFRETALGGTCEEWVTRNLAMFQSRPSDHKLAAQVVPLLPTVLGGSPPVVEIAIVTRPANAWLDIGASITTLNRRWVDRAPEAVELIQNVRTKYIDAFGEATLARIERLRLGNALFAQPIVLFADMILLESGEPAPAEMGNIIGMNILLQYRSVCFDWDARRLYLGELGPCRGGETPYRNWLTGQLGLAVDASVSSTDFVRAKIDTGSPTTYCSEWFMGQNMSRAEFSFGSHRALTGACVFDPEILFNNQERGADSPGRHILLGMDTLGKFAAFGWRLNPLKVYFVPKPGESNASELPDMELGQTD